MVLDFTMRFAQFVGPPLGVFRRQNLNEWLTKKVIPGRDIRTPKALTHLIISKLILLLILILLILLEWLITENDDRFIIKTSILKFTVFALESNRKPFRRLPLATLLYFTPPVQPRPTYRILPTLPYLSSHWPTLHSLPSLSFLPYPSLHVLIIPCHTLSSSILS